MHFLLMYVITIQRTETNWPNGSIHDISKFEFRNIVNYYEESSDAGMAKILSGLIFKIIRFSLLRLNG